MIEPEPNWRDHFVNGVLMPDRERKKALLLDLIGATERYNRTRAEVRRVHYSSNVLLSPDRQHRAHIAANAQAEREVIVEVFRRLGGLAQEGSRPTVEQELLKAAGSNSAEG
jgi:hypothetical protein